jgi:hypothetical protein
VRRRHLFVAAALLMAVALSAWPSSAGGRSKFSGIGANAAWYLGDEANTAVYVGVFDGSFQSPPGRAQKSRDVFVDVYQSFCDTTTDELVDREYFAYEPAEDATITISSKLETASVSGTVELYGVEFRTPGCDEPKYEEGSYTGLGEFVTSLTASWSGAGNTVRNSSNYHFNGGPDCKFSSHSSSKYRQGSAGGTISGDLELGELGASEYAELFSTRDMSVDIGSGCYI